MAAALKTGSLTIYDINKLALQACYKVYKDETGRDLLVDNELDRQSVTGAIYRQEAQMAEQQITNGTQNSVDQQESNPIEAEIGFGLGLGIEIGTGLIGGEASLTSDVAHWIYDNGEWEFRRQQKAEVSGNLLYINGELFSAGDYQQLSLDEQGNVVFGEYEKIETDKDAKITFGIGLYFGLGLNVSISINLDELLDFN